MATDEPAFRIRPPRVRRGRPDEVRIWSTAFKRLVHIVRMSSTRRNRSASATRLPYGQRCAVRVSYSANRVAGQWRAHGRYLVREAATHADTGKVGFGPSSEGVDMGRTLNRWQQSGDERMFKLIISPEFGERMDLVSHTRDLMSRIEQDLGTKLEWTAVCHYNTSHPHVHIALRGINERGEPLWLERDYILLVIRRHAENLCTAQIGYRTQADTEEAQRREIDQYRYTSLDRLISRARVGDKTDDFLTLKMAPHTSDTFRRLQMQQTAARLCFLEKLGLAERYGSGLWRVRSNFEEMLRAMQRASDRQKTLAAEGALLSDPRLPIQVTSPKSIGQLEGRVLGHGQEDATGRTYVIIEGIDSNVHFIYKDDNIESARHQGQMKVNSYVRLRRQYADGRGKLVIDDLGDAERLLADQRFVRTSAQRLIKSGLAIDQEPRWGGWLGRYHARLHAEAEILKPHVRVQERTSALLARQ